MILGLIALEQTTLLKGGSDLDFSSALAEDASGRFDFDGGAADRRASASLAL